ncbi:MAG TPA: malto-oligosyltrehalose synthase [Polyangia bacterium]|jgi:(1->4)-alpha-D-glucan 1-alpha-D-glucosylmutase|nr:malto-oligosyltrehalose synthase [Polyangia bacterium]
MTERADDRPPESRPEIARVPLATYRLQLNKTFTLRDATALVPYLDALGISDIYASPFLAARPGSIHGYDVVDPTRLNPEVGSDEDLDALVAALRDRGMGLIMDVVPNHMCIASVENRFWLDVLENGRSSPYARFFDIDWYPPKAELTDKVLLPVLGEQYGRVLESQQLTIEHDQGAFWCRYFQSRFPIGPRTVRPILEPIVAELRRRGPDDAPDLLELESILTAVKHLPTRADTGEEQVRERQREKEIVKKRLAALVLRSPEVAEGLLRSLEALNGHKGEPRSFDALEALLADQAYRLCFWGVAAEEINYRRFFDINDLAAIRIEEPAVLELVHGKAFQLLRQGKITGLRIDHVDGLYDPTLYLDDLRRVKDLPPFYLVVEKILSGDEELPAEWPVHGTTGYEFLNELNALFVDADGARAIARMYERAIGAPRGGFDELTARMKKLILDSALSSELYVLARRLDRISEQHRWSRDFTLNTLHRALAEVIAGFPVYRTYVRPGTIEPSTADRRSVLAAIRNAKRRNQTTSASVFDFIADLLLLRDPEGISDADRAERRELVLRLQQLTGPVMAKGLEDTSFYRYFPLASLNEVGGRPTRAGSTPETFHRWSQTRAARWPHALSASATHDTKRGEDVRARIDLLSEQPRQWWMAFRRWQRLNRPYRRLVDDTPVPDSNEEYLLYQTLLGAWPGDSDDPSPELVDRISAYMNKAIKEAKQHTSWINVNEPYERAVDEFVRDVLDHRRPNPFLDELRAWRGALEMPGMLTSLSQLLLKITAPGVPDFYQGTELWDLHLVDPDNRRPVDYARRRVLLEEAARREEQDPRAFIREQLAAPQLASSDGALKLFVARAALRARRAHRTLFERGGYLPLPVAGDRARQVIAFARTDGAQAGAETPTRAALVVVGRLFHGLSVDAAGGRRVPIGAQTWGDTRVTLPIGPLRRGYREVFSRRIAEPDGRGQMALGDLFADLPLALLEPHG